MVITIIPARGGSKGVPNKNIRDLGGHPLIAYSIKASQLCSSLIDRCIVSTDDEKIAEIALKYGAEVPFIRPNELARDESTDLEWVNHVIKTLDLKKDDLIVHLRPTTPLRDFRDIVVAILKVKSFNELGCTSLRSAHLLNESPYKMFTREMAYFRPFGGGSEIITNLPRQKFEDVYVPNGVVDILKVSHILKHNNLHGNKILAYITDYAIEVDSERNLLELKHHYKDNEIYKNLNNLST